MTSGVLSDGLFRSPPEKTLHRCNLHRAAALAGHDEQGLFRIRTGRGLGDGSLVSGVENGQVWIAFGHTEHGGDDLGAQAAASHPEQVDVANPFGLRRFGERQDSIDLAGNRVRHVQPAKPCLDRLGIGASGRCAPGADIAVPDTTDYVIVYERIGGPGAGWVMDGSHKAWEKGEPVLLGAQTAAKSLLSMV